jgi:hypothetical protein
MLIKGIEGMSPGEVKFEVEKGGRFIFYQYCVSALIITIRQPTDIYFVRAGQNHVLKGLPWTLLTLVMGWWGIPWGPIYTVGVLWKNLHGGEDVTSQVLLDLNIGFVDVGAVAGSQ